jgi:hypothetical protein
VTRCAFARILPTRKPYRSPVVENASLERVRLEKIRVQEVGARTSLRFRVKQ